jgi:putative lipoprotein
MSGRTWWRFIVVAAALCSVMPVCRAQGDGPQVTGSVAYRERIALPADAVVDVQLLDTSIADVAAQVIAEAMISAEGRQVPISFSLQYDPAKIDPSHRYSVRATIRSGDGMLMFSTTQAYPVLTHGAPSKVNLLLHTVGHGPKPGTTAKKEPAPGKSEVAEKPSGAGATVSPLPAATPEPTVEQSPQQATESSKTQTPAAAEQSVAATPGTPPALTPPSAQIKEEVEAKPAPAETVPAEPVPSLPEAPSTTAKSTPSSANAEPPQPGSEEKPGTPVTEASKLPEAEPLPASPDAKTQATAPEPPLPEAPSAMTKPQSPSESAGPPQPTPEAKPSGAGNEAEASTPTESQPSPAPLAPEPESTAGSSPPLSPLTDTQWRLVQLGGADIVIQPPTKPMTLAFSPDGARIAGSAGCNSYIGTFTDDNGRLTLNPGGMTMMMCMGGAMQREQKFVSALRAADGFKVSGNTLFLTSKGKVLAKFENLLVP